ncbi:hypothetical protein CR513_15320, partial [Mucuna pruriens]
MELYNSGNESKLYVLFLHSSPLNNRVLWNPRQLVERRRIFKFLHDLNFEYDLIWVQILDKEKLSSCLRQLITIINEDHVRILGSSSVQLESFLSLHNVVHVPKLANNFISKHRLIQDWNCVDLATRRTIGIVKEQGRILQRGGRLELLKSRKLGQLLKFCLTINVLDIHRLVYNLSNLFTKESTKKHKVRILYEDKESNHIRGYLDALWTSSPFDKQVTIVNYICVKGNIVHVKVKGRMSLLEVLVLGIELWPQLLMS